MFEPFVDFFIKDGGPPCDNCDDHKFCRQYTNCAAIYHTLRSKLGEIVNLFYTQSTYNSPNKYNTIIIGKT